MKNIILQSVAKTGKVVIVHEAPVIGGFGGEIAAILADKGLDFLEAPVKRRGGAFLSGPLFSGNGAVLSAECEKIIKRF